MKLSPMAAFTLFLALTFTSAIADTVRLKDADWTIWSQGSHPLVSAAQDAKNGIEFRADGAEKAGSGIFQIIPCPSGKQIVFSVQVRRIEELKNCYGQLSIEWKDSDGKELGRSWGPTWRADLAAGNPAKPEITASAPEGAVAAALVISLYEEEKASGGFRVEDVTVK